MKLKQQARDEKTQRKKIMPVKKSKPTDSVGDVKVIRCSCYHTTHAWFQIPNICCFCLETRGVGYVCPRCPKQALWCAAIVDFCLLPSPFRSSKYLSLVSLPLINQLPRVLDRYIIAILYNLFIKVFQYRFLHQ